MFCVFSQASFGQNVSTYDEHKKVYWVSSNKLKQERYSASKNKKKRFRDCEIFAALEHQKKNHEYFIFTYFDCDNNRTGYKTYRVSLSSIGFNYEPSLKDLIEYVDATTEAGVRNSLAGQRGGEIFSVAAVLSEDSKN